MAFNKKGKKLVVMFLWTNVFKTHTRWASDVPYELVTLRLQHFKTVQGKCHSMYMRLKRSLLIVVFLG